MSTDPVAAAGGGRRAARTREIEERIVAAARRLFIERGYGGTTLTDVADEAGVAHRTVYVRFGTKAALLNRTIDVALVGDVLPIPVAEREGFRASMSAPTLDARIRAFAKASAELFDRAADIMAIGFEAARQVPEIAAAAEAGRRGTLEQVRSFWRQAHRDGLLGPGADVAWIADASAMLIQAETYLLGRALLGWTPVTYRRWLTTTMRRLAASGGA